MHYLIKDDELVRMIDQLAALRRKSKIDVIRDIVRREFERVERERPVKDRLSHFYARTGVLDQGRPIDWAEVKRHDDKLSGDL